MSEARAPAWTVFHRWMWFWCWLCHGVYMRSPVSYSHATRYGRFQLWLLGYAGAYAHSDRDTFPLCLFFYRSKEEQSAAWDRFIASRLLDGIEHNAMPQADGRGRG